MPLGNIGKPRLLGEENLVCSGSFFATHPFAGGLMFRKMDFEVVNRANDF